MNSWPHAYMVSAERGKLKAADFMAVLLQGWKLQMVVRDHFDSPRVGQR